MRRGFAMDATIPTETAAEISSLAESLGYGSFWVNGSPPEEALDSLAAAAEACSLPLGVGVVPLTSMAIEDVIEAVRRRGLPESRLWLGMGSSRRPGALEEMRHAVRLVREELDCKVVMGAVGPKMTQLAGEIADCVIFTWWPRNEVANSRQLVDEAAADADREPPIIASYVRCALVPEAAQAVDDKAASYQSIPRYARVFSRNDMTAADAVVTGTDRSELLERIEAEEVVIDLPVIRAITGDDTAESFARLARATAPSE